MLRKTITPFFLFVTAAACTAGAVPEQQAPLANTADAEAAPPDTAAFVVPTDPIVTDLIDADIPPAIAGQGGWDYIRVAETDLNGDGQPERAVLIARVEIYRGQPAWDDGQPWQVYVENADGHRTYLYTRRLQLGQLTMRATAPADGAPATIVLIEHLPERFAVYESIYTAPDSAVTYERFVRRVDPRGDTAVPEFP